MTGEVKVYKLRINMKYKHGRGIAHVLKNPEVLGEECPNMIWLRVKVVEEDGNSEIKNFSYHKHHKVILA